MIKEYEDNIFGYIVQSFSTGVFEPMEILHNVKSWLIVEMSLGKFPYDDIFHLSDFADKVYRDKLIDFCHDISKEG